MKDASESSLCDEVISVHCHHKHMASSLIMASSQPYALLLYQIHHTLHYFGADHDSVVSEVSGSMTMVAAGRFENCPVPVGHSLRESGS